MSTNAQEIADATSRILIRLQQDPGRELTDWPGVTMQQLKVMTILYAEGPTRVSRLATRLNVSTPTVTGILDRLVRQELTYRADDPHDRRVVLNDLTETGREMIEHIRTINSERLTQAVETLSSSEQESVVSALNMLANAIESITAHPAD